jgi:hypothetical protein
MGRRKTPISGEGPVPTLAEELRTLRVTANSPTYRAMSKISNISHNALSEADRGQRLPTWPCVRAYLVGCGVTDVAEFERWRQRWESTKNAVELRNDLMPTAVRQDQSKARLMIINTITPNLPDATASDHPRTMQDLVNALNDLIASQGFSSASRLVLKAPTPVADIPAGQPPKPPWEGLTEMSIRAVLTGRTRPTLQSVIQIITACGGNRADVARWTTRWQHIANSETRAQAELDKLKKIMTSDDASTDPTGACLDISDTQPKQGSPAPSDQLPTIGSSLNAETKNHPRDKALTDTDVLTGLWNQVNCPAPARQVNHDKILIAIALIALLSVAVLSILLTV